MPEFKIEIRTEAELKAAEKAIARTRELSVETQKASKSLKEHGNTAVDVGAKLEHHLVKGLLKSTIAFGALHAAFRIFGTALKPVQDGFEHFVETLGKLASGGQQFRPIKGLAELFETMAAGIEAMEAGLDSLNTKARTHADLWQDIEKTKRAISALDDEEKDVNEDILSAKERELKIIDQEEEVANAKREAEKEANLENAKGFTNPVTRARAEADVAKEFSQREEEDRRRFRIRREGAVATAQERLAGAAQTDQANVAGILSRGQAALPLFEAADAASTASRTRQRELEVELATLQEQLPTLIGPANAALAEGGPPDTRFQTAQARIAEINKIIPGLHADVNARVAAARAAAGPLPAGVTTAAGFQDFLSQAEAGLSSRTTGRAKTISTLGGEQAANLQGFRVDQATAGLQGITAFIRSSQALNAAILEVAAQQEEATKRINNSLERQRRATNSQK